jgi:hypothetical protein
VSNPGILINVLHSTVKGSVESKVVSPSLIVKQFTKINLWQVFLRDGGRRSIQAFRAVLIGQPVTFNPRFARNCPTSLA